MTKTLKLPSVVTGWDYDNFDEYVNVLSQFGIKIKYIEIGCAGDYYAVFYQGRYPNKKTIRKLLINGDFGLNQEDVDELVENY